MLTCSSWSEEYFPASPDVTTYAIACKWPVAGLDKDLPEPLSIEDCAGVD